MNFQTIMGIFIIYFMKLRDVVIVNVTKEKIPSEVKEIIKPYEELLIKNGFVYKSAIEYNNMYEAVTQQQYTFYYFNEEKSVHAFIGTMPYRGALRPVVLEYSTFYESYHIATTHDCFLYNLPKVESITAFDHYHGSFQKSFESHLEDRKLEGEVIRHETLDEEGLAQYLNFQVIEAMDALKEANIIKTTASGLKYTFSIAFVKYIYTTLKGHRFASKILQKQKRETSTQKESSSSYAFKNSEELSLAQGLNYKPKEIDKKEKIRTFIISGIAFVLFFGLIGIPFSTLPMLIVILLIHELGHFYAMRFFGYKDTSIFFIPLFGAAAKGEKEDVTAFQEFIVFLAGPLPGMIISLVIGIFMFKDPSLLENGMLREYAIISFVLNYFNLLPIFPLDGGKIVQTLLFSRYPKIQFYFFLVSLFVIIVFALFLESIILGVFAFFLFLSINHNYHISTLISKVLSIKDDKALTDKVIKILVHDKRYKDIDSVKKGAMLKQALKVLNLKKPSLSVMVLGMLVYLVLLILPVFFYFIYVL